jgi:hypothetical protein
VAVLIYLFGDPTSYVENLTSQCAAASVVALVSIGPTSVPIVDMPMSVRSVMGASPLVRRVET